MFFRILSIWSLRAKMWNLQLFARKLSSTERNLSPQIGISKHHFQRRFIRVATVFLMRFVCLPNLRASAAFTTFDRAVCTFVLTSSLTSLIASIFSTPEQYLRTHLRQTCIFEKVELWKMPTENNLLNKLCEHIYLMNCDEFPLSLVR